MSWWSLWLVGGFVGSFVHVFIPDLRSKPCGFCDRRRGTVPESVVMASGVIVRWYTCPKHRTFSDQIHANLVQEQPVSDPVDHWWIPSARDGQPIMVCVSCHRVWWPWQHKPLASCPGPDLTIRNVKKANPH